jgi:polyhydroxyalkanoate synthase
LAFAWVSDIVPMDGFRDIYFTMMDEVRRTQANAIAACGLGPVECDYRVLASGPHWSLRSYAPGGGWASVFIAASPIKRPYIYDIDPAVSVIRYCLAQQLRVYLVEWKAPALGHETIGLDEYADQAISECLARIDDHARGQKPFLLGHSLGGTLAAIHAALHPQRLQGVVLLGAPLCFERGVSRFRDALVSIVPSTLSDADLVPGSLLSHVSALASPSTFVWERLMDAVHSTADPRALRVHARVERWALDEVALPGQLVHQIVEWLYREDRFCRGTLTIGERKVGPASLRLPILAVVNAADEIAPVASVTRFTDAMAHRGARIISYPGESGVGLQHLALLVGRNAHDQVWPRIIAWLKATALSEQRVSF